MITTYAYDDIRAIVEYGDNLIIAFGTNPTKLIMVSKLNPSVILAEKTFETGYYNVSSMLIIDSNLWVLFDLAPGRIRIISIEDESVDESIIMVRDNPIVLAEFDTFVSVITSSGTKYSELYNKTTFAYISNSVGSDIHDTYTDGTYNWFAVYTTSGNGTIARRLVASPYTLFPFTITGFDKIISLTEDEDGVLWAGSNTSPGKIAKIVISGDVIDSIDIFTLNTGENIPKQIVCYDGFIWCALSSDVKLLKAWEESGSLSWETYDIDSTSTILYSRVLVVDSIFASLGMLNTPGKLYQYIRKYFYTTDIRTRLSKYFHYLTDIRTKILKGFNLVTDCRYLKRFFSYFTTDVRTKYISYNSYKTDFRFSSAGYDALQPKSLADFLVKKDGAELLDVDYTTLKINFNLNNIPSNVEFTLARRHDNFNQTMAGVTSIIDEENKIQVYDGTILLFTGYINQIKCNSESDTVSVMAEDVRYKISRESMKLPYGSKMITKENTEHIDNYLDLPTDAANGDSYIVDSNNHLYMRLLGTWADTGDIDTWYWAPHVISISTKTALLSVFSYISTLIKGYDSIDFGFFPEYTADYGDCCTLIDNLIRNSANMNWYVDENECIRFQKVGTGTIKSLNLSGINIQRHLYDVILNDISLNRRTSNYYTAFEVRFGKNHIRQWIRSVAHPNLNLLPIDYVESLSWYAFQDFLYGSGVSHNYENPVYCGENLPEIYGYTTASGRVINGYFIYQWLAKDDYLIINPVMIGSGDIIKTVYMTQYGIQTVTSKYEEREDSITKISYLWETTEECYNKTTFALDTANFELSQNNKLLTEAQISLILDSFEYNNITFKNLINLSNTIEPNIFCNNNGFPLNISSYSIDCSNRIVTLSLTNYGKTFYQRTGNILLNYKTPIEYRRKRRYLQTKMSLL